MGNNLYSNLVNFYNVNDENFKEFMAKIYKEMLTTHRDVQYVKEHLTEEIEKKLEIYLVDGKFNINIEEKVNEFLENNQEIKGITAKLIINTNKIEDNTEKLNENTSKIEDNTSKIEDNTEKLDNINNKINDFYSLSEINVNDYSDIINEKISQGMNIKFPNKTIKISKPIIWNGEVSLIGMSQELSKIQPNSDFKGDALLIAPQTNSKFKKGTISDITFDCNFIVNTGVWLKNGCFLTFKNSTIKNFLGKGLYLGVYDGTSRVYASFFTDLKITGDDTFSKPLENYPNYCVVTEQKCFDNNFINMYIWNAKESLFLDRAGSNRIISCHGWGDLPSNFPKYCFDLSGIGTLVSNSKADSPKIAGFRINNFQNFIIANQILLNNTDDNGYDGCYFEFSSNNNNGTKIMNNMCTYGGKYPSKDCIFNCNTIHDSVMIRNNQIISGWRYLNAYDNYLHNIPTNKTAFDVTFPKPLSSNKYAIIPQALYEAGNVTITNKTTTGYTVNVQNAPSNGYSNLITRFVSVDA